jgi:hypothetical protein
MNRERLLQGRSATLACMVRPQSFEKDLWKRQSGLRGVLTHAPSGRFVRCPAFALELMPGVRADMPRTRTDHAGTRNSAVGASAYTGFSRETCMAREITQLGARADVL